MVLDRANAAITNEMPKFDLWVDEFVWSDASHIDFVAGIAGEAKVYRLLLGREPLLLNSEEGEYASLAPRYDPGFGLSGCRGSHVGLASPLRLCVSEAVIIYLPSLLRNMASIRLLAHRLRNN